MSEPVEEEDLAADGWVYVAESDANPKGGKGSKLYKTQEQSRRRFEGEIQWD